MKNDIKKICAATAAALANEINGRLIRASIQRNFYKLLDSFDISMHVSFKNDSTIQCNVLFQICDDYWRNAVDVTFEDNMTSQEIRDMYNSALNDAEICINEFDR